MDNQFFGKKTESVTVKEWIEMVAKVLQMKQKDDMPRRFVRRCNKEQIYLVQELILADMDDTAHSGGDFDLLYGVWSSSDRAKLRTALRHIRVTQHVATIEEQMHELAEQEEQNPFTQIADAESLPGQVCQPETNASPRCTPALHPRSSTACKGLRSGPAPCTLKKAPRPRARCG
jgi:hypothetical protein